MFLFAQEHLWFLVVVTDGFFPLCFFTDLCVPEVDTHAGFWIVVQN